MNFADKIVAYWAQIDPLTALLVFVAYFFIDALFAYYTLSVMRFKAARAATVGSCMYLLAAFGVISYTKNPLYLVALVIGAWLGTYVVVRREKNRNGIAPAKKL